MTGMVWIYLALAVPIVLLMIALVSDFFAGLDEQRQWSDPALTDPQSMLYRSAAANREPSAKSEPSANSGPSVDWSLAG